MNIALVTIFDRYMNYGNKLQNYASVKLLRDMGYDVETLVTEPQYDFFKLKIKRLLNKFCGYGSVPDKHEYNKMKAFHAFDNKYLSPSYKLLKGKNLDKYDLFAVGSDQVWNPFMFKGMRKDAFMLSFARPDQKLCMAPSIGIDELPKEWHEYFIEQWDTFTELSVRESSGAEIIKELTGRDAEVVIDPTLMLDAEEWRKISKKLRGRQENRKYILKYFLGAQSDKNRKYIERISKDNGYEIYELMDKSHPFIYEAGPSEFIGLIDHAELICTDSFHACVFSILFDKPFLVFDRDGNGAGMGSRISTLLLTLGLERKLPWYVDKEHIFEHDYSNTCTILKSERTKAMSFLERSISEKKRNKNGTTQKKLKN